MTVPTNALARAGRSPWGAAAGVRALGLAYPRAAATATHTFALHRDDKNVEPPAQRFAPSY
jgi:hypothetical protein